MANPEHIAIAKSGSHAISRWRELTFLVPNESPIIYHLNYSLGDRSTGETFEREFVHGRAKLDLSGGYLSGIKLPGVDLARDDLSRTDLTGCNLRRARLSGTILQSAHLSRSNLSYADLTAANLTGCSLVRSDLSNCTLQRAQLGGADLSHSDLQYANLEEANLSGANLSNADLSWTNLAGANLRGSTLNATSLTLADLSGADLRGATITNVDLESAVVVNCLMGFTKVINCDLSKSIGLDSARHTGPSALGLDTIARSGGLIPKAFLENVGVAEPLLAAQDAMKGVSRSYPTVLIVGSAEDNELAARLRSGLAASQIPAWAIAADDEAAVLSGGILLEYTPFYDGLALLCTAQSLESPQTSTYLAQLASNQHKGPGQTTVALAIDDLFYQREDYLCNTLREGQVLDFRGWENAETYEECLRSLVNLLTKKSF